MSGSSRRHAALATLAGTGATVAITVAQAVLLIPLCLRYLGTPLYGAWLGASELLVWIQLLDVGIPNLVTQRVGAAVGRTDLEEAARWASTGLLILSVIAVALVVVGMIASPLVAGWARVDEADAGVFTACFRLGVVASALLLVFNGGVGLSRGVQRTGVVNVAQVTGAIVGLSTSAAMLLVGAGLWALAVGLLARALVSVAGGIVFLAGLPAPTRWIGRPSRRVAGEVAGLAPSMAAASVGYLLANNSEILLVTTIFGPVPAAIYALTRRAIDGVRSLLDSIAYAVHGAFAHLVTADDRHRARRVLGELLSLRLAIACLAGAIAASVNRPFVTLLFGAENFGGVWLTMAFVVQLVVGGQALLANFLFRAAGHVREGSLLLAADAIARVLAMSACLLMVGLAGAPAAAACVSVVSLVVTLRWLGAALPDSADPGAGRRAFALAPIVVLFGGLIVASSWTPESWGEVLLTAGTVAFAGSLVLWHVQPERSGRNALIRWIRF
jgi:O-antigen/teichoic acid export membrane protein